MSYSACWRVLGGTAETAPWEKAGPNIKMQDPKLLLLDQEPCVTPSIWHNEVRAGSSCWYHSTLVDIIFWVVLSQFLCTVSHAVKSQSLDRGTMHIFHYLLSHCTYCPHPTWEGWIGIMTNRLWGRKKNWSQSHITAASCFLSKSLENCLHSVSPLEDEAGVSSSFPNWRTNLTVCQWPWAWEYMRVQENTLVIELAMKHKGHAPAKQFSDCQPHQQPIPPAIPWL